MPSDFENSAMASLNIRQLDSAVKEQLRLRAAHNGRSMEAEARAILKEALVKAKPGSGAALVEAIRGRFRSLGGVELELPPRGPAREPPSFE
jgi:antitoxin FitA